MTLLAWSFALFAGIGVGLYLGAVVRPFVHRDPSADLTNAFPRILTEEAEDRAHMRNLRHRFLESEESDWLATHAEDQGPRGAA